MERICYLGSGVSHERQPRSQTVEAIISMGGEDGLVYTVRAYTYSTKSWERKLTHLYTIHKSVTVNKAWLQCKRQKGALDSMKLYTLSCIGLSNIELKRGGCNF